MKSLILNSTIHKQNISLSFETLMKQLKSGDIKVGNQVNCDKNDIINMAISIIKNLPIKPIYAYKDTKNNLIIFDGNQRVMSSFLWYNGILNNNFLFNHNEYDLSTVSQGSETFLFDGVDITWFNLSSETQRYIKMSYIDFVIVDVISDYKQDVIDFIKHQLNKK